jgi:hypothetical protein
VRHAALSSILVRFSYYRLSSFELDEIFAKFICCFFADLRVLNRYHSVHSFSAFSNVYDNSGLFGIYLTTVR